MLVRGNRVGHYRVEGLIDEGSFASVFRVTDERDDTPHALKLLRLEGDEWSQRERVLREGSAMLGMRHPNLVGVREIIEHKGMPGFVMEYVAGPNLVDWLNTHETPLALRLQLFEGIAEGLHHLHRHGIIHRDLQPANILIERQEQGPVARIIDLGLSKHLKHSGITDASTVFGTLGYMAPEQIHSTATVGHRADVFSLGCILYVLACEAEPFDAESQSELLDVVMTTRYTPPRERAPDLPDAVVEAIVGCLSRDPHQRYGHSREVLRVLAGTQGPEGSAARP